ncbi:acyl-CoA thioesterase [Phaeobacter marinintestinus]|uniref:acyl-CoA thioesterase n=1 Tax=Falsiphaeobacter marinintestinus TaxID=1492905 RepID=UPI0011B6D4F8|nr:acyl-CoA thioesterase [Phaeobacter marinintestinus]
MSQPDFTMDVPISFGHCDPAQIVFYPNYFRWFDHCFHAFVLKRAGGHLALCEEIGAHGLGLVDVGAQFLTPATANDVLTLELRIEDWTSRTLRLAYKGRVGERTVLTGFEVRAVFVQKNGRMRAGDTAPLRERLEVAG